MAGYKKKHGLVLCRKEGQSIRFYDDATGALLMEQVFERVPGDERRFVVRLIGPKGVRIVRGELVDHNTSAPQA